MGVRCGSLRSDEGSAHDQASASRAANQGEATASERWERLAEAVVSFTEDAEDDEVVDAVALLIDARPGALRQPTAFERLQSVGAHVTPIRPDSPIPDTRLLSAEGPGRTGDLPAVFVDDKRQLELFARLCHEYADELAELSRADGGRKDCGFTMRNHQFAGMDALVMHAMLRDLRPLGVLEIGSGFSSRLIARALQMNGRGRLTVIDAEPDAALKEEVAKHHDVVVRRVQEGPIEQFDLLVAGDVLSIDSSHVARMDSDVNFLMLEVLPRLAPGVVVHIHDIFLGADYPRKLIDHGRFWNEQYLVEAFLSFNDGFEILLSNSLLRRDASAVGRTLPLEVSWWGDSSLWIRRRSDEGSEPQQ